MALSGTFSGAADSAVFTTAKAFNLSLNFASTGSVTLQRRLDGTNWRDVETFTASAERIVGEKTNEDVDYRLHCTAAGGSIAYLMKP